LNKFAPSKELLAAAKRIGFSDRVLANAWEKKEIEIRN
jgi:hypothetical protein